MRSSFGLLSVLLLGLASPPSSASEQPRVFENSFAGLLSVLTTLSDLETERLQTRLQQERSLQLLRTRLTSSQQILEQLSVSLRTASDKLETSDQSLTLATLKLATSERRLSQALTKLDEQGSSLTQLRASLKRSQRAVTLVSVAGPIVGAGVVLLVWQPWQ